MIGAELGVGSGDRALDVAERRVDPFEGRHAGGLPPGAGADRAMASDDPVERVPARRPSVRTSLPGASQRLAPRAISRLRRAA